MLDFHTSSHSTSKLLERPLVALLVFVGAFGVLSGLFALNRTNFPVIYQGRLTDSAYLPVTDSARNVRIKIWDDSTAGSCVWSTGNSTGSANCALGNGATSVVSVNINNGNFTIPLGNGGTNNPEITTNFSSGDYFIEVIVDNENPVGTYETLSPRKQLGSVPYAYDAAYLNGKSLDGVAGGQTFIGGTAASENLTLQSTTHATKGKIFFGANSAYDEGSFGGLLGVGTTTPSAGLHIQSTLGTAVVRLTNYQSDGFSPNIVFQKSRGTPTTPVIVNSQDEAGYMTFSGHDGTAFRVAAQIVGKIDGTPGASDMPGRLAFNTTPDGSASPVERMRIDNAGNVGIGSTAPLFPLHVSRSQNSTTWVASINNSTGTSARSGFLMGENTSSQLGVLSYQNASYTLNYLPASSLALGTGSGAAGGLALFAGDTSSPITLWTNNGSERMRIDSTGNVGIGTTSPTERLDVAGGVRFGTAPSTPTTVTDNPLNAGATTINVVSTTGYPSAGTLLLDAETVTYTGTTATSFTGVARGAFGTTDTSHVSGTSVVAFLMIGRTTASEAKMGLTADGRLAIGRVNPSSTKHAILSLFTDDTANAADPSNYTGILVSNQSSVVGSGAAVRLGSGVTGGAEAGMYARAILSDRMELNFYTEGTIPSSGRLTRLTVTPTGRVAIGTSFSNPAEQLDVDGSALVATRGSEKVTNGTMDTTCSGWTLNSGWTCDTTNNEVDHTGGGGTAVLEQDVSALANEVYVVSFLLKNRTAGSVTPAIGGVSGSAVTSINPYSVTIRASNPSNLTFTPSSDFNGSIDDVSVKKLTGGNLYAMGNVGIGTTSPGQLLHLRASTNSLAAQILFSAQNSSSSTFSGLVGYDADNRLTFMKDNSQTVGLGINNNGNVGINTLTPTFPLDIVTTSTSSDRGARVTYYNTDASGPAWRLYKARGTATTPLSVAADDSIGAVDFKAHDGTGFIQSAFIQAVVPAGASVSTSTVPADLRFATTTTNSPGTRMTITSDGRIGIGTITPNSNAILDVASTTKAFMPPRMTTAQRDAIPSPTAGMVIYNTTTNKLNIYTTAWEEVSSL